ncbi:hypothetical protein PGTUg99_012596 [Puccinia graminis f. sp. tritici]|uniref:Uncharacterized protein n=1 Tax=Puccinia graminis f. sp. tritici TaxID=56615 RepID=A0A5B0SLI6_PUCGR|nr:hypothetical protein PGTUg99_012596 [Puccinia graminis f. sp. tritici]
MYSAIRPSRTAELDGPHPGTAHKYYAFQMLIGDGTILNHDRPAAPTIHLVPREHRATLPGAPNTSSFYLASLRRCLAAYVDAKETVTYELSALCGASAVTFKPESDFYLFLVRLQTGAGSRFRPAAQPRQQYSR